GRDIAVAPCRKDEHADGHRIGYVNVTAGIHCDALGTHQAGVASRNGGEGGFVEESGAVSKSGIDGDARGAGVAVTGGAVRNIDLAAGIQSDAFGEVQTGVAPTDSGEGRDVTVAPLGVDGDAHGDGVGDVNV